MKTLLRSARGLQGILFVVSIVALVVVNRGQALPGDVAQWSNPPSWTSPSFSSDEPPMVDAPKAPQKGDSPRPPFTPPSPTPLPPEQAAPFMPAVPVVGGEPMDPPVPVVRLRVRVPARIQADKEIEYRLTVENVSRADAHHVLVRDRLPRGVEENVRAEPKPTRQTKSKDGLTDLLWELDTLKAGEHKEIVLTIKPKGTEDVANSAYVQFEYGQKVRTRIAPSGLHLRIEAPAQASLPNPILFRLAVSNTGSMPAHEVVLKDELPKELVYGNSKPSVGSEKLLLWKLGTLKPGETRRVELEAIPTLSGDYSNKAEVSAAGGVKETKSVRVTIGEARLKISTSGPQRRMVDRPIPFHISVRNDGTLPITNVQVSDEVPRGIAFLSADAGGQLERGFVRWSLGTLTPGERRSLLMVVRASSSGWCWNEAAARADPRLSDKQRSEPTRIDDASGPAIEIDKSADSLDVGQKAKYTIRIVNMGKMSCRDGRLLVTVPDEMSIRGHRGQTNGQQEGQKVRFDPLPPLDTGQHAEYVIEVEAKKAGEARLRVQLLDDRPAIDPRQTWEDKTIVHQTGASAAHPPRPTLQVREPSPVEVDGGELDP